MAYDEAFANRIWLVVAEISGVAERKMLAG